MTKSCAYAECSKELVRRKTESPSSYAQRVYCNRECLYAARIGMPTKELPTIAEPEEVRRNAARAFNALPRNAFRNITAEERQAMDTRFGSLPAQYRQPR